MVIEKSIIRMTENVSQIWEAESVIDQVMSLSTSTWFENFTAAAPASCSQSKSVLAHQLLCMEHLKCQDKIVKNKRKALYLCPAITELRSTVCSIKPELCVSAPNSRTPAAPLFALALNTNQNVFSLTQKGICNIFLIIINLSQTTATLYRTYLIKTL